MKKLIDKVLAVIITTLVLGGCGYMFYAMATGKHKVYNHKRSVHFWDTENYPSGRLDTISAKDSIYIIHIDSVYKNPDVNSDENVQ